jgi:hypothetical protein
MVLQLQQQLMIFVVGSAAALNALPPVWTKNRCLLGNHQWYSKILSAGRQYETHLAVQFNKVFSPCTLRLFSPLLKKNIQLNAQWQL